MHKADNMCRIPVTATYTLYKGAEKPVMTSAEYVDIPADTIARFLIEKLGGQIPGIEANR